MAGSFFSTALHKLGLAKKPEEEQQQASPFIVREAKQRIVMSPKTAQLSHEAADAEATAQREGSIAGTARNFVFEDLPRTGFEKLTQPVLRAGATVAGLISGKPTRLGMPTEGKPITPKTKATKEFFGTDKPITLRSQAAEIGVPENSKFAPLAGAVLTAADLSGLPGKKEVAKQGVKTVKRIAGNIRLDKFDLPDEGADEIARIIDDNKGFIEQRRGVRPIAQSAEIAREIAPKLRLKQGSTLNAEEIQSLGNAVGSLQQKVAFYAEKVASPSGTLLDQARLAESQAELVASISSFSGATAEAGRALAQLRNVREAILTRDARVLRDAIKLSGGKVPPEEIAGRLLQFGDDALGQLRYIRTLNKVGYADKIFEVFINSILSNPVTHAVNITGNTLQALLKVPVRAVQAGIEATKGSKREVYFREVPELVIGAAEGMSDGVRKALYVLRNGLSADEVSKLDVSHMPAIEGTKGEIIRTPTKMLQAADEFMKAVVGTAETRARAYRMARQEGLEGEAAVARMHEIVADPPKELMDAVDFKKLEATFQQPLGDFGNAVLEMRGKTPGAKYIIPFVKTPVNIAKTALKTSPLGVLNVAKKALTGGYKAAPGGQMTEEIAQAAVGSMIALPVVFGALNGNITGAAPKDSAERDAFYRSGKLPYSVKVGDKWYSYRRLEPIGTIVGLTADLTNLKAEEDIVKTATSIVGLIGRNLNDKTFLSGISSFIDAITDPERYGSSFINRTAAGMVPFSGLSRFATQLTDREFKDPEGPLETVMAQTPSLSRRVPARLDAFGNETERTLAQVISPVAVTPERHDVVDEELARLGVTIGFPGEKQYGQKLERGEYRQFLQVSGKVTYDVLKNLITSEEWDDLADSEKTEAVEDVITRVRARVKERLLVEQKAISDVDKRLEEKGVPEDKREAIRENVIRSIQEQQRSSAPQEI